MKPHLAFARNHQLWVCHTNDGKTGIGSTPKRAYIDWMFSLPACDAGVGEVNEEWAYLEELERGYAQDRI